MSGKKFAVSILALTVILFVFTTLLPEGYAASAKEKKFIRIGFSIALTGVNAEASVSQMNALKLWRDTVNKQGGIYVKSLGKKLPVKFVYYDDKGSPDTAVRVYEKLITEDKVDLLFAPWGTTCTFAIAPLAERYKFPIIGTTAASVKLRDIKSHYFWFITSCMPDWQMQALVNLLKSLKIKTVGVTYVQDLFPRENLRFLLPDLKKAGIKCLIVEDYPIGVHDMTVLLSNIKAKKPQALISLCYPGDCFLLTHQLQAVQFDPSFLYELVGPSTAAFSKIFPKAEEGVCMMGQWSPKETWPGAKAFAKAYQEKWKIRADYLDSTLPYMGCQILAEAIEKAGSLNRAKIRYAIAHDRFQTIGGPVKFKGIENIMTPSMVLQYQKGEEEIIWPPKSATAKPLFPKPAWPKS